jgi:hypothetical protein
MAQNPDLTQPEQVHQAEPAPSDVVGQSKKPAKPILGRSATDEDYRKRAGWQISLGPLKGSRPEDRLSPEKQAESLEAVRTFKARQKDQQ